MHMSNIHKSSHIWRTRTQQKHCFNTDTSTTTFHCSLRALTTLSPSKGKLQKGRQKTITKMSSATIQSTKTAKCFSHLLSYLPPLTLCLCHRAGDRHRNPSNNRGGQDINREWRLKKSVGALWYSYTPNEIVVLKHGLYLTILHVGIG
jgi:hypothetical protein